ncbi:DUF2238 domain-containing protein [Alcanivorax sediminis]|uniref:DUF2238 domain-containing protein n=1 Tax=Alcanivorax sediminis TaxID=2663008 RepID=A0A6N7LP83_9GAMM|nr:DUF2238 domain-containing protein [Alcanivorax sediminis]MQX51773.1 DUF2238 domain-containing protein [Alcanivorax sediminis]
MSAIQAASPRYALTLFGLFWVYWLALAIAPLYRDDWMLENVLVIMAIPLTLLAWRRYRFSTLAITAYWLFMLLHVLGSHYTYAEVPYNDWSELLFGRSLNEMLGWQRNHFDRLVHGLFGLLFMPAFCEWLQQATGLPRRWQYTVAISLVMAISGLYEIMEWVAALLFGGDLGQAYLGTQGDIWDAQKDMALAGLGSLLGATILFFREPFISKK